MGRRVATVGTFLLVVAIAVGEARQTTDASAKQLAEKTIVANEHALYDAVAKADKASFESLVVPDGAWTTSAGFVPMGMLGDTLGAFHLTKWRLENLGRVVWLDDNSAMVLYASMIDGRFGDYTLPPTSLASTVWIRRDGKWRAIHHQETELKR